MSESINYTQLMHEAMRGLLARVLRGVAKGGLPGKHYFFITFNTGSEGVDIPDWLVERYPDEMTIVLQEWFANLNVTDEGFSVTLNFGNEEVPMSIPFDAIRKFIDPSVEFGLKFEAPQEPDSDDESPMVEIDPDADAEPPDGEVVSLDQFRK